MGTTVFMSPNPVTAALRPALAAGALILLVGLLAVGLHHPWLFPSLGPTAMLLVTGPDQPAARPWNTLVGHGVGLCGGLLAAWLFGTAAAGPALAGGNPTLVHAAAAAVAMVLTLAGGRLLDADHPPAAATTLLIALGALPADVDGAGAVCLGVFVVCAVGEPLRRRASRTRRALEAG